MQSVLFLHPYPCHLNLPKSAQPLGELTGVLLDVADVVDLQPQFIEIQSEEYCSGLFLPSSKNISPLKNTIA
jgi:hypothetical protein